MFRLAILLVYLRAGQTMTPITKHLLTPLLEEGEGCGYLSCTAPVMGSLNIHVVPHTHTELGHIKTFEQHFTGRDEILMKSNINVKRILDYVITELWAHKERKFTFSDLPYLYKWWSIRDETVHRMVYQLLRQGRLYIVGGGWGMTDESTATYQAIIDHFTFALRKINATFLECARPLVTWQSDVFGHTGEFASLMTQMGFDGHFINPISYDDEMERMRTKRMEFIWQGSKDLGVSSEIFTHKLFDGYWSPPGFCFGGQCEDPILVDSFTSSNNIKSRVKVFVEAMQYRQSPHYATSHIMVMMGQRMGYYDAPLWFENIEKLMRAVNEYSGANKLNMHMYYSSPACYLRAVHETNASFPVESDDFVPIAYDKFTHFSGIFTSRPTLKYAVREGTLYLQITKQLQVLAGLKKYFRFFEDFHWIMGVLQDHNVLTGAMRPFVRDYYVNKIYNVMQSSRGVIDDGLATLMKSPRIGYEKCLFNISYCEYTDQGSYHIVVYNPLAWKVTTPVRLPVSGGIFTVFLPNLVKVQSVIMKIPKCIQAIPYNRTKSYAFELVFIAEDLPALGYRSYFIQRMSRMRRSVVPNDHFTKVREKNDDFNHLDDNFSNDGVEIGDIGHADELFSDNGINTDEIVDIDDLFGNDEDKRYKKHILMMRSVGTSDSARNYDFDNIDDHLSNVNSKNNNIHSLISRKRRSVYFNDSFTDEGGKSDKFNDINDHFRLDREKRYEIVQLHDVHMGNFNKKVASSEAKPDLNFKEPNLTKIVVFDKKSDPNNDLKRIFESIKDEGDNVALDIVYESARKGHIHHTYNNITNKNNKTFKLNTSSKDFDIRYGYSNKKHDGNNAKHILDSLKEHTTSKPKENSRKNNLGYTNKHINVKTEIDKKNYAKNKNKNILKGLKRCNCKIGRLKREYFKKNNEEAFNDTIDQTFGNKTLRFIHFIQDEVTQKQNKTKNYKRDIKFLKQDKEVKIKNLKQGIKQLIRKMKNIKKQDILNKQNKIKDFKREIKELKQEFRILTKTKRSNETRAERSLFKKIKSAKKKYLRRQTNNLKIDDESLMNNDYHYDDDDDEGDYPNPEDFENTTGDNKTNERYSYENVTDFSNYIVTPRSREDTTVEVTTVNTTTTTEEIITETTTITNEESDPVTSVLYSDSTDMYISNEYINITTDINKNISYIALANGLEMELNINFYYYASDDPEKMGRTEYGNPGAYVFRPMDPEPAFIKQKPKFEVYKSSLVEEIHSNSDIASFVIRLYKNTPFFEVEWVLRDIPVYDEIGKEVFIRYNTDLDNNDVFYTDANGRQTVRRVYGHRPNYKPVAPEAVAGNFYPVTSKITIEDPRRMIRFSVFNDRTQGGSASNGVIDLMLNRRIITDDAGFQASINETENEIGTTVSGKHYIYLTKLSTKINKLFEKKLAKEIGLKPQVFVPKRMVDMSKWETFQNEFVGVKKIPVGLNILTLQEWNDGTFLVRIENYLEKSEVLKSGIKKIVLQDLFTFFRITRVKETTLAGNMLLEDFEPLYWHKNNGNTDKVEPIQEVRVDEEISFKPQQIRTFIVWVEFKK